ncbi:MAG: trigger factor [Anaerolineae bacterium]
MFEVKKELLDSHEVILEVVFEDEAVEAAKRAAAREISSEINIPGFRRGRAPYTKVVQAVGEAAVLQEATEHLLDKHYPEFLEKAEVSPYGPGDFVDMKADPLTFKIRVPLQPRVDLGDYQSLREDWTEPSVSEEEIDQVLDQIREEHAVLEPVDRPAELGDELMVNVHATVDDDVIVDEDDIEVVLSETRPFLSPEFVEALVGMSAGEEKSFTLTLPETIEEPSLRGVEGDFDVEVTQVYERNLPELDDALASTVGSFETYDELVADIRERILSSKQDQAEAAYRANLVDQLVEQADIDYPPQLVADTLDDMVDEVARRVQREQKMELEDALRLEGRTVEQLREQLRPQAERRVKQSLVLQALAEEEELEVSEDEIVQEFSDMLGRFGMPEQMAERPINIESDIGRNLRSTVLGRKVMERLAVIGRGELEDVAEAEAEAEVGEGIEAGSESGGPEPVAEEESLDADASEEAPSSEEEVPEAEGSEAEAVEPSGATEDAEAAG